MGQKKVKDNTQEKGKKNQNKKIEQCLKNITNKFQWHLTWQKELHLSSLPWKMLDQHKEFVSATYDIKSINSLP